MATKGQVIVPEITRRIRRKEYLHNWYLKNKDYVIQKSNGYHEKLKKENPEKFYNISHRNLKKYHQTAKGIYSAIKQNSRRQGRPCLISQKDFVEWHESQIKVCHYCEMPQNSKRMSIDRKDNSLPYQLDNIVLACDDCNSVKGDVLSESEMLLVGKLVMQKRWQK